MSMPSRTTSAIRRFPEPLRGLFRQNIPLRHAKHLVSHHELAHRGRAEQRRKEVRMEMPLRMLFFVGRLLVEAYRVRETHSEQLVVAFREAVKNVRQTIALLRSRRIQAGQVPPRQDHRFERPHRPEWDQRDKVRIPHHQALLLLLLQCQVTAEQARTVALQMLALHPLFPGGNVGQARARPDLAMGMRIARSHHRAAVFEDLHITDGRMGRQLPKLTAPFVHDASDRGRAHRRQSQIVARRKTQNATDSRFGARDDQVFDVLLRRRSSGEQSGKIVIEDESPGVGGIPRPTRPEIARAHVTAGVIFWNLLGLDSFRLSLPRPLVPVRRDEDPLGGEWIEAAVRVLAKLDSGHVRLGSPSRTSSTPPTALKTWIAGLDPARSSNPWETRSTKLAVSSFLTKLTVQPPKPPPVIREP